MSRFDITLGLVASLATVALVAVYGLREESRMESTEAGFHARSVETGAELFDQYCSNCHGPNASGSVCPPLDETSGLHGGDLGPGVACRLEEVGWDPADPLGYVVSVIEAGRPYSTRPLRYPGNRISATPLAPGDPTPEATDAPIAAMPAWSEDYGGPLRGDQIEDLANYIVAFRSAMPEDPAAAKALACGPHIKAATPAAPTMVPSPTATIEAGAEGSAGSP